ncbi:MAG: acetoacetate--CoA ligase [Flavobacteriaceae bacterium]
MNSNHPIWTPKETTPKSQIAAFQDFVSQKTGRSFDHYEDFHQWSVSALSEFWECIAQYFEVRFDTPYDRVVDPQIPFYNTQWFSGAELSYAAHIERNFESGKPVIYYRNENEQDTDISWNALFEKAAAIQKDLIAAGVQKGDSVVGYLTHHPVTIAAFLATNALGAIWSCCSPDFGVESVLNRLGQLNPKVLLAMRDYTYNGKTHSLSQKVALLEKKLPSRKQTLLFDSDFSSWNLDTQAVYSLHPLSVSFDHPIWVLYSSGTTGQPKAIVHRTGGMLLEQMKALALHQDLRAGERFFWHTTTGWMMWNYALGSLLCKGVLCIYDGAPGYPDMGAHWRFAADKQIHHFGQGAPFLIQCMKAQEPAVQAAQLTALKTIGSTGAPLSEEAFHWLQLQLPEVHIVSLSGGTDVCSAFLGGNPQLPVYAGYLQCVMLGASIEAWNEQGESVWDETGELVLTQPMPCMPVFFWNDTDHQRYSQSYFQAFKGVWTHGDWIERNAGKGIKVLGRSDATLNKNGIRIGTAELYSALDQLSELDDHLVLDLPTSKGSSQLLLLVVSKSPLNTSLTQKIKRHIREQCSPRHVPDRIVSIAAIPYTLSGKKLEVPAKKILLGGTPSENASFGALKNPESLELLVRLRDELALG